MKKKIVFVSIFVVFILVCLPSISALDYRKSYESKNLNLININKTDIKEFYNIREDSSLSHPQFIISFFLIRLIRLFRFIRIFTVLMPFLIYVICACILWIIS